MSATTSDTPGCRVADRYEGLPVVAYGPQFRSTAPSAKWRARLQALSPLDEVDVLLDDGRIVRVHLRATELVKQGRRTELRVWVWGISGSYAEARIRPAGGWWRLYCGPGDRTLVRAIVDGAAP